jgi:hypothetical protein
MAEKAGFISSKTTVGKKRIRLHGIEFLTLAFMDLDLLGLQNSFFSSPNWTRFSWILDKTGCNRRFYWILEEKKVD